MFSASLNLRTRIYLSAGLLVAICCLTSGIGWLGQSVLLSNIEDYQSAELVSSRVIDIDRNVQKLKSQAESYIHFGMQSKRRAADRLLENLVTDISATRRLANTDELTDLLDEMMLHLRTFGEQLGFAAQERGIRTAIVNEQLPIKAEEVQTAVDLLKRTINERQPGESSVALLEVVQSLGKGREHLLRYLIDPEADQIEKMLAAFERARTYANSVATLDSDQVENCLEDLAGKLDEFQVLCLRAVQATRGYLYYSNVVMAGEISEFVHFSNRVKKYVDHQQQLNRSARTAAVHRGRTFSVIATLAAVAFAGLLGAGLSYSIIRPISLLTNAFRRLSAGETLEHIPESQRDDEIGRMSQAAQVFSAKNRETRDLLEQSQSLSQELANKAKALEETNLELDSFAYVASHDLKAPLRGINSLAAWVQEDCGELLPDDSKKHLSQMRDRVQKMDVLLDDLLEYSRVGRIRQQTESVDLNELVQSVIDMTDHHNGVKIRTAIPPGHLETVVAPLKQVLLNLITNAIKYNDKGNEGRIEIAAEDLGEQVSISVSDNGTGIDPRYHERIFQMYQRIAQRGIEGSGMGLAIVKKQVEYFGGSVVLQSDVNRGAKFTFTWPSRIVPQSERANEDRTPNLVLADAVGGV